MKLYDLATVVLIGAVLIGAHVYAMNANPDYAAVVQKYKGKVSTYHQKYVEPYRDQGLEPAWSKEAFEAK